MALTGQYGGSERWQGTVIIENGDWYGKYRLPVVFSMERTGAPLPTAGSGVPGVMQGDCQWSLVKGGNSYQSHNALQVIYDSVRNPSTYI